MHLTKHTLQLVEKEQNLSNPKLSQVATGTKRDMDLVSTLIFSKGKLRAYRSVKRVCPSPSYSVCPQSLPASRAEDAQEAATFGGPLNQETPGLHVSWIWLSQGVIFPWANRGIAERYWIFPSSCIDFEWPLTTLVFTADKIFGLKIIL